MTVRSYYKFSYPLGGGRPKLNKQRDGDAFIELAPILATENCRYGGIILNSPPPGLDVSNLPEKPIKVNHSFLKPTDLLVLTTRPPLDDENKRDKKIIYCSHTDLEAKVFKTVRPYFGISTRSNIQLSEEIARELPSRYAKRANITFRQNQGAYYTSYRQLGSLKWFMPELPPRTAAYLLIPRKRHQRHPQVLCSFGMGGTETLIWSYLLRKRYWAELELDLDSPRFVMVEMFTKEVPESPLTLSFADKWRIDVLLNIPL